ncbi:MAG: HTTM domain-containing protein [Myxococcota bacterium]
MNNVTAPSLRLSEQQPTPVVVKPEGREWPWTRAFWLGEGDLRPLGLYRFIVGMVALWDIFKRSFYLREWHTDEGVLPRMALLEGIARPWRLSLLDALGTTPMVTLFFIFGAVSAACLAVGYRTRLATFCTWLFVVSVQERNLGVTDSSDTLYRVMLFWLMFAPAGAAYSLDRALAREPGAWPPRGSQVALRFMQLQVIIVYFVTSVTKNGPQWIEGSAAYRALQVWDFARPTAAFLVEHAGFMARFATWGTLVLEFALAALLWYPNIRLRKLLLLGGLMLHGFIEATLNVGMFSLMMYSVYTLFFWPEAMDFIDRRRPRLRAVKEGLVRLAQKLPAPAPHLPAWVGQWQNTFILGVMGTMMGIILWDQAHEVNNRIPRPPAPAVAVMESLSLWQNWKMFAPNPVFDSGQWTGQGTLTDGTPIDVLAHGAPTFLSPPEGRWWYERWAKYRLHIRQSDQRGYLAWFGKYLCRQYNNGRRPGEPLLDRFELVYHLKRHRAPWEPDSPATPTSMWTHYCIKVPDTLKDKS